MKTFKETLIELDACEPAREWSQDKSFEEALQQCERGDWLLWLHFRLFPNEKRSRTMAKAYCALTVQHLMKDQRSINACNVAIGYGEGNVTDEELKAASAAAYAAYYAYDTADAAYDDAAAAATVAAAAAAADAAAAAAAAAYYTAAAAAAAADAAAYYTTAAAAAAAADAAKKANQKLTADICRKYLIWENKPE